MAKTSDKVCVFGFLFIYFFPQIIIENIFWWFIVTQNISKISNNAFLTRTTKRTKLNKVKTQRIELNVSEIKELYQEEPTIEIFSI